MKTATFYRLATGAVLLAISLCGQNSYAQKAEEADADHKILPLETITVEVFGEPALSNTNAKVSVSGKVSLHKLGEVLVAGKTTSEVAKELVAKYDQYLVDPQIIVRVMEYRQRAVNVTGAVVLPGAFPLPGEQKWTILDALGRAGGLKEGANKNAIDFTRKGKTFRYKHKVLLKTPPEKLLTLEPGDTIDVKYSKF